MDQAANPIGVFDSGVGGISALQAMIRLLPQEHFIYYGDTANAPYGTKKTDEVIACVREVTNRLLARNIKALVIACNTATGAAASTLRRELDIPVIGMEPALKPASELRKSGDILVLATPLTLHQEKFNKLMEKYGEGAVRVPCTGLMELVEQENWEACHLYLKQVFAVYDLKRVDAVVLGCTHYVFLKDMIRKMLPDHIAITEGSDGTARQLKRVLVRNRMLREDGEGLVELETSGRQEDIEKMHRLLNRAIPE